MGIPRSRRNSSQTAIGHQLMSLNCSRVVLALAAQHPQQLGESVDPVGAHPIHALLVGNNEDSLALAMKIYEMAPKELTRVRIKLFLGESALHIAAVNRHEALIVKMVQLRSTCHVRSCPRGCAHKPRASSFVTLRSVGTAVRHWVMHGASASCFRGALLCWQLKTESPILSLNERADALPDRRASTALCRG